MRGVRFFCGMSCRRLLGSPQTYEEKIMKQHRILAILVSMGCTVAPVVFGQGMFGGQPSPGGAARSARLFGKTAGFTAAGQMSTVDSSGVETINDLAYAVRDGMVRMEIDLTKTKTLRKGKPVKNRNDDMEGMASMGFDKQVTLVRPDKQATYLVYPGLKAYCEVPKKTSSDDQSKSEWKELGQDTVDGHPCMKYLVTTTNADGTTEESTAWKATDLKDFVIQTVTVSGGDTTTLTFKNIKFDKPAAALFELPADYTKYGSVQEMMMGAMQQMMQNMGEHGQ
jgi:outer membrane lipoprotein-sorting protein